MKLPGADTLITLAVAFAWGQVKIETTIFFAQSGWPAWVIRGCCYAVAIVTTLTCYRSTNYAIGRWKEWRCQRRDSRSSGST